MIVLKLLERNDIKWCDYCIKGIGGYHLVCDATNDKAVQTLRGSESIARISRLLLWQVPLIS